MGYMTNFLVYVFAMLGVIMIALFVFKQTTSCKTKTSDGKNLKVIDTLSLTPRKTLYVVSSGNEKFLIAGDADRTVLISKLEDLHCKQPLYKNNYQCNEENTSDISFKDTIYSINENRNTVNKLTSGITSARTSPYDSVIKNLAEKMRERV